MQKKRPNGAFTLLELLVVLALIALTGTLVGVNGKNLLAHHRFRNSVANFWLDLSRYRILAMTSGSDILCTLHCEKGICTVFFRSEHNEAGKQPYSYELPGVVGIELGGKKVRRGEVVLFSSGRMSPIPSLTFLPRDERKPITLDPVYPFYLKEGRGRSEILDAPPSCPVFEKND